MATKDLLSIGALAVQLRQPVHTVARALIRLGVEPSLTLNGIPHFEADVLTLLLCELAKESGRTHITRPSIIS
jgi:hypothetical protein